MHCSNGTVFDYIKKECEHPRVANCLPMTTMTTTTHLTTTTHPTTTTVPTTTSAIASTKAIITTNPIETTAASTTQIVFTTLKMSTSTITILKNPVKTTTSPEILAASTRSASSSTTLIYTNPELNMTCTTNEDYSGLFEDCSKFLRCIQSSFIIFSCAPGTLFDYKRKMCVYPDEVICLSAEFDKKLTCTTAEDYSGVSTDCRLFRRCVNTRFYEFRCAPGTLFDYKTKRCDFPGTAECLTSNS